MTIHQEHCPSTTRRYTYRYAAAPYVWDEWETPPRWGVYDRDSHAWLASAGAVILGDKPEMETTAEKLNHHHSHRDTCTANHRTERNRP